MEPGVVTNSIPLIPDGACVWKGQDPRRGFCYFTFSKDKLDKGSRAICFKEMEPILERLGFQISEHWVGPPTSLLYSAVLGLKYHTVTESDFPLVNVSPIVHSILLGQTNNKFFKQLLSLQNE